MGIVDSDEIPSQGRLLGLDVGSKTIGMAISDISQMIASPLKTFPRKTPPAWNREREELEGIIKQYKVVGIVIGYPKNLNNTKGEAVERTEALGRRIENVSNIIYWDERFSTIIAERAMLEGDLSRKKRAEKIDEMAATVILQGYLDFISNRRNNKL